MTDNFDAGLTELAAALRTSGLKPNAGHAAFVLRARDRLKKLENLLGDVKKFAYEGDYYDKPVNETGK